MRRGLEERDFWVIDSLTVPAALYGTDGYCLRINAPAELASGVSNAELVGRYVTDLVPQEERANVEAQFRRAAEHGEPTDFETSFIDMLGHRRSTRAQHIPLQEGGEILGVIILAFEGRNPPLPELAALRPLPHLTQRQHEILELLAAGQSTAEMATQLTLSKETIRNHLRNIFRELQVHTRPEAIAAAQRLGFLATAGLAPQDAELPTTTTA
jgi:PAS domain S-box-containing protein